MKTQIIIPLSLLFYTPTFSQPTKIQGTYTMKADEKKYRIKLKGSDTAGKCKWTRRDAGFIIIQFGKWKLSNDTLTINFKSGSIAQTKYVYKPNTLTGFRNDKQVYNK